MDKDVRVFLSGHIDVPEDRIEAVRAALPRHVMLTRAEKGCIAFDVTESEAVPGRFVVSEVFEDQASFDAHQARTKASDWFVVTREIPRSYAITVGEPRDEAPRQDPDLAKGR